MPAPLVPNDLSEEQLKAAYWYVTHKILLRRILEAFLIVVCAVTISFSGYLFTLDILNAPERLKMLKELTSSGLNPAVLTAQAPRPLSAGSVQVLSTQGKYDFLGTVANPNQNYAARFSYRFVSAGVSTQPQDQFILPGEQKFVVTLGAASDARPSGATLEVIGVAWERIDRHVYPDWKSFSAERLNFSVSDISYVPEIKLSSDKPAIGRTSFTVANDTGFGYYGLRTLVLMYRGSAVVAANTASFAVFPPGVKAGGEVTWYENYGAVTQIKVIPEIDILDEASYIRTP